MSHSRLAASASGRWIRCPGSIAYVEFLIKEGKIPEDTSGPAARLGTAVHAIIEYCIKQEIHPEHLSLLQINRILKIDDETKDIKITQKEINGASMCVERVNQIRPEFDEVFAERKYDLSFMYNVDVGGTCDISGFSSKGLLGVEDYKNGRGKVEVYDNFQLMIYALGAYHNESPWYNFTKVRQTIIQPNASHPEGKIRSQEYKLGYLLKFEEQQLIPAIDAISRNTAQLVPGPIQCEWCPARHQCEANAKQTLSLAQIDFENVSSPKSELPSPVSLSHDQLAFVLDNESRIMRFLDECKKYALKSAEKGDRIGDYCVDDKIGNRKLLSKEVVRRKAKLKRLALSEIQVTPETRLMTVAELESYLLKSKKWSKDKVAKFMGSISERPKTGKKLIKRHDTAEKDFSK